VLLLKELFACHGIVTVFFELIIIELELCDDILELFYFNFSLLDLMALEGRVSVVLVFDVSDLVVLIFRLLQQVV